jgi:diaminopropionate ammonia-lyase
MATTSRRSIYSNPSARSWVSQPSNRDSDATIKFHRSLPDYAPTKLHSLEAVAKEIGAKSVLLKDETSRLGLPSFKILGASWAIHQAIVQRAGISPQATLDDFSAAAKYLFLTLFAATDGNHGRAVARMAHILGISQTKIFVPTLLDKATQDFITGERLKSLW